MTQIQPDREGIPTILRVGAAMRQRKTGSGPVCPPKCRPHAPREEFFTRSVKTTLKLSHYRKTAMQLWLAQKNKARLLESNRALVCG